MCIWVIDYRQIYTVSKESIKGRYISASPAFNYDLYAHSGPSFGDDPHFAIFLPSGKLLCYTVQGEHSFAFNLISNEKVQMNALFVPDLHREEVTWIGSLGIVIQNSHFQGSNTTQIQFDSKINRININDKVSLEAKNIDRITFHNGKLLISEGPMIESFHYPSVHVNLDDLGMKFTVNFTGEHLDMMWNKLQGNEHSHGLIGGTHIPIYNIYIYIYAYT